MSEWLQDDLDGFARSNLSVPSDIVEMDLAMHPRTVFVHVGLTARDAGAFHVDMTMQALLAADIACFAIPGGNNRVNVAISVDERERAYAALRELFDRHTGYVTPLLPKARTATTAMRGNREATWEKLSSARVVRLLWYRCEPSRNLVISDIAACDIEFWTKDEAGRLVAPKPNRGVTIVSPEAQSIDVPIDSLGPAWRSTEPHRGVVPTFCDFTGTWPDDVTFPVDVVYTWVDGSDPAWLARRAEALGATYHGESGSAARFLNRDELRYSLRSLHANAPWVRKIWIVTDSQRPDWLREDERLTIVDHRDIFTDVAALPTFNSHAIESQLHHIDDLSEHFLYFNDDMFLGQPVVPSTFFLPSGITRIFWSQSRVPMGEPTLDDTPVDAAAKNNRVLLQREFGRTVARTFQHTPYALRRSIMDEIEERFPSQVGQTMRNRFRSTTDLSIPSSLHHYYALMTGRAVAGTVRYSYTQLAVPDLAERLNRLLARRDTVAICLNDAYTLESEIEGQVAVLSPFLDAYFPVPSPWESGAS